MGHIGGHLQVPDIWHLPRTVGLGVGTVLRSQLSQELSGLMYQNPHDVFVRHAKHPFKQKEDLACWSHNTVGILCQRVPRARSVALVVQKLIPNKPFDQHPCQLHVVVPMDRLNTSVSFPSDHVVALVCTQVRALPVDKSIPPF